MKRLVNIIFSVICTIIIIFSAVFAFLQARLIFSLDWIIYDNSFNGLIRYLFRFIISLFALITMILELINIKKNNKDLYIYLCVFDLSLLVASIIISLFATNYVGLVCLLLSTILVIIKLIKVYIDLKNYKKEV